MLGPFVWISVPQYLEWMTAWLVHFPVLLLVLDTAVGDLVTVGALVLRRLLAHMAGIHGGTADVQSKRDGFQSARISSALSFSCAMCIHLRTPHSIPINWAS